MSTLRYENIRNNQKVGSSCTFYKSADLDYAYLMVEAYSKPDARMVLRVYPDNTLEFTLSNTERMYLFQNIVTSAVEKATGFCIQHTGAFPMGAILKPRHLHSVADGRVTVPYVIGSKFDLATHELLNPVPIQQLPHVQDTELLAVFKRQFEDFIKLLKVRVKMGAYHMPKKLLINVVKQLSDMPVDVIPHPIKDHHYTAPMLGHPRYIVELTDSIEAGNCSPDMLGYLVTEAQTRHFSVPVDYTEGLAKRLSAMETFLRKHKVYLAIAYGVFGEDKKHWFRNQIDKPF